MSKEDAPRKDIPSGDGELSRRNSIRMFDISTFTSDVSYKYEPNNFKPPVESGKNYSVQEALELARESQDGIEDPFVVTVLEATLHRVWSKILEEPDGYVMTRTEFAVFNFMQREDPDKRRATLAAKARANYWNNTKGLGG
ncbi:hypothetical protein GGS26DRAFT_594903 [Hypomontagnella submonticulosa]|nr:hypothetical protein GGS26DRAFT_594903 [Hypomontagnella submonticulosa]